MAGRSVADTVAGGAEKLPPRHRPGG